MAENLSEKADTFLTDHFLRLDRWTGKHMIKEGELDAYREKVTPNLYDKAETAVKFFAENKAAHGSDFDKWPKSPRKRSIKQERDLGQMTLLASTVDGGKEAAAHRSTTCQGLPGRSLRLPSTGAMRNPGRRNRRPRSGWSTRRWCSRGELHQDFGVLGGHHELGEPRVNGQVGHLDDQGCRAAAVETDSTKPTRRDPASGLRRVLE